MENERKSFKVTIGEAITPTFPSFATQGNVPKFLNSKRCQLANAIIAIHFDEIDLILR